MWERSSDFITISWLCWLRISKIVYSNRIEVHVYCHVIKCHITRCVIWKCGGNHFPQTEDFNKSSIHDYYSLSMFVANHGYESRSIPLQNMMNVWKVLCIRKNCLLTFQLGKELTLFISMSTIKFWYIGSMGKQLVTDVTLNIHLNIANITWWFITTKKLL